MIKWATRQANFRTLVKRLSVSLLFLQIWKPWESYVHQEQEIQEIQHIKQDFCSTGDILFVTDAPIDHR